MKLLNRNSSLLSESNKSKKAKSSHFHNINHWFRKFGLTFIDISTNMGWVGPSVDGIAMEAMGGFGESQAEIQAQIFPESDMQPQDVRIGPLSFFAKTAVGQGAVHHGAGRGAVISSKSSRNPQAWKIVFENPLDPISYGLLVLAVVPAVFEFSLNPFRKMAITCSGWLSRRGSFGVDDRWWPIVFGDQLSISEEIFSW